MIIDSTIFLIGFLLVVFSFDIKMIYAAKFFFGDAVSMVVPEHLLHERSPPATVELEVERRETGNGLHDDIGVLIHNRAIEVERDETLFLDARHVASGKCPCYLTILLKFRG